MKLTQKTFREIVIGTLLYSVVIGFFNDYTQVLHTRSYSITFALAVLLQLLTFATLQIKNQVVKKTKIVTGTKGKFALIFGVWGVAFLSKFVFLWVIGIVFKDSVEITGFFNIFFVVGVMLIAQKLIDLIDSKLPER